MEPLATPDESTAETRNFAWIYSRQTELFEVLAALDKVFAKQLLEPGSDKSYELLLKHVEVILPPIVSGFFMPNPETFEFAPGEINPERLSGDLKSAVDKAIDDGTFGWALQQNRAVPLRLGDSRQLVLHALSTPRQKFGMFAAIVQNSVLNPLDGGMQMLSLVLQRIAFHLETSALYAQVKAHNVTLERTVHARTLELQYSLMATREAEAKFKAIFIESPDVILLLDAADYHVLTASPAIYSTLGYQEFEVEGNSFDFLLADAPEVRAAEVFRGFHGEHHTVSNCVCRSRAGARKEMEISGRRIPWKDRKTILVILRDATIRRQLEDERIKLSKLESLGTLAGGIAHTFNNALHIVLGNLSLARTFMEGETPAIPLLNTAEEACHRAKAVAAEILTFARGGDPVCQVQPIQGIIHKAAENILKAEGVRFELLEEPEVGLVNIDASQMGQAIGNIFQNALEAMPGGGFVTASVRSQDVTEGQASTLSPGRYLSLTIRDTGHGIPASIHNRVFDPYFSTKSGKTGLGLTAALSIIRKHGGEIQCESTEGRGTSFHILLPVVEKSGAVEAEHTPTSEEDLPPLGQRILIMDDEPAIRELTNLALERLGFSSVTAENGEEAIRLFEAALREEQPFGLVILDLMVPQGMGGKDTLQHLRKLDSRVKAIVSSGYSNDPVIASPVSFGFDAALAKPFTIDELAKLLGEQFQVEVR